MKKLSLLVAVYTALAAAIVFGQAPKQRISFEVESLSTPVAPQTITAEYLGPQVGNSTGYMAETFLASVEGTFSDLSLFLVRAGTGIENRLVIDIMSTSGGLPNAVLGRVMVLPNHLPTTQTWYTVSLRPLSRYLSAGTQYAVAVYGSQSSQAAPVNWGFGTAPGSPGEGGFYHDINGWHPNSPDGVSNFLFIANVEPIPEPSTYALLIASCALCLVKGRRLISRRLLRGKD